MKRDAVASLVRLLAPSQNRCVVASDLCRSSALWSRAIKTLQDQSIDGVDTMVHSRGDGVHDESVLFGWVQSQLR